ncbi:MAG TPA: glycoside hydrolase family 97 N-terminal domain-containing protein, partial [bacterium]
MRRYSIPLLMYLFCFFVSCRQDRPVRTWTIFSPDKRIRTTVVWHGTARRSASEDAEPTRLFYSVDYASDGLSMELIRPSPLGIRRQDGDFSESLAFRTGGDVKSIRESYDLVTGKRSSRTFHANEMVLDFKNADSARIQIVFRVYDDGVAFQYRFPDTTRDIRTVLSELTGFRLPDDGSGFLRSTLPGGAPAGGVVSMEKAFQNRNGWPLPALFKLHNGKAWVLLAEAGIDQRYGGSHLVPVNAKGSYVLRISDADESTVSPKSGPASRLPWSTPWRVVVAGNRLADIVESNLTTDLSRPHGMDDVRWIRPGRILWMGWQNGADPFDWGRHYAGIDLAGRMGWEYVLFDLSRGPSAVGGISDLVQYALERKVGILRHYPSVESAYHWICDAEKRRGEFARLRDSGVKGICVD